MNSFRLVMLAALSMPILVFSGSVLAQPSQPLDASCDRINNASPACRQASGQGETDPIAGPDGIISKAAALLAIVAGIAAVIYIVLGALAFITAGGDQQKTATARSRVFSGVIGLAVVALSWAIVSLITKYILQT